MDDLDALNQYKKDLGKFQEHVATLPQLDCPVKHNFAPGVYMREITMPEGAVVIGKTHRTSHLNIISKGECLVAINGIVTHIKAPYTFVSDENIKKVVFMISEVVWSTVHPTDETDLDKIEALVIDEEADKQLT